MGKSSAGRLCSLIPTWCAGNGTRLWQKQHCRSFASKSTRQNGFSTAAHCLSRQGFLLGRGATSVGQPCGRLDDDRSSLDDDDGGGGESAAGKGPEGGPQPARTPAGKPPPPQRVCGLGIGQDWAKAPASGPGHSEGVRGRVPRRPARATRTLARPPRGASAPPPQRTCRCRMRTSGAWGASRSKPRPAGFGATCKGSLPKPTGVYPEDEQRGRVRRASGEGG